MATDALPSTIDLAQAKDVELDDNSQRSSGEFSEQSDYTDVSGQFPVSKRMSKYLLSLIEAIARLSESCLRPVSEAAIV